MQNEFLAPTLQEAIEAATFIYKYKTSGALESRNARRCAIISDEIRRLKQEIRSELEIIESISLDTRRKIRQLGTSADIAKISLALDVASLLIGISGVVVAVRTARSAVGAASILAVAEGAITLRDVINSIDGVSSRLEPIRREREISGSLRKYQTARRRIWFFEQRLNQLQSGFQQNGCAKIG